MRFLSTSRLSPAFASFEPEGMRCLESGCEAICIHLALAVMIALALAASLLVLLSVLAFLSPRPRTEPEANAPPDDVEPKRQLIPVG